YRRLAIRLRAPDARVLCAWWGRNRGPLDRRHRATGVPSTRVPGLRRFCAIWDGSARRCCAWWGGLAMNPAEAWLPSIIYHHFCVDSIRVRTKPNSYQVLVNAGLLKRAGREVRRLLPSPGSRVFVITSPNVRRHWGERLEASLRDARVPHQVLEMYDGEPAKRLHTVEQLAEQLVGAKADRKSLLVAFGGGVVGDSVGFLAAVFMRGIPVVQVPTTVVAQLD